MGADLEAYRLRFSGVSSNLAKEVDQGLELIQELLEKLGSTEATLTQTKLDLDNEVETRRRLQQEAKTNNEWKEQQERQSFIVAVIDADADGYVKKKPSTHIMADNKAPVPFIKGKKITWPRISKPKVSTSNPMLAGFAKAINIDEVNELDGNKLNSLSAEQLAALYNFGQDILGRVPEDELDAQVISALMNQGLEWFQFVVSKAASFQQNAVNEKNN